MRKTKILIVDDYNIPAMILPQLLEHWGFDICEQVSSGKEAIEKAKLEKPDIVLIDINLTGNICGIEAANIIKSRFGIPIIFMTAYSDDETRATAHAAGPAGYFVKPLDYHKLRSTIEFVSRCRVSKYEYHRKERTCIHSG